VLDVEGRTIGEIFGYPDDLKFHSCMTLFAQAAEDGLFARAIRKCFGGEYDRMTLEMLSP